MIGKVRWRFREVDSTQTVAFQLSLLGAGHGTVVSADYQNAGRGRHGRSWDAAPGTSLMFSVLLRPHLHIHQLGTLPVLTGLALADVIGDLFPDQHIAIKWPNDVLVNGLKTAGILIQTRDSVAVLGMGVNIADAASSLPPGAASLGQFARSPVKTGPLFDTLLSRLDDLWANLTPTLSPAQVERINSRLWLRHELVTLQDGNRELHGRVAGIANSGGLRLDIAGDIREIMAGEITRGPRPITT